jgi:nucleoside-diphosphate-sugar epimerase
MYMRINGKNVLVTGGASFIGSHLVYKLLERDVNITVVDNLSTGRIENLSSLIANKRIEFIKADLLNLEIVKKLLKKKDIVFHLASRHGGRGFIEDNEAECSINFAIDSILINECVKADIQKIIFTSSGCVYPTNIQEKENGIVLNENLIGPPFNSDTIYGWSKLMAELTLKKYYKKMGLKSAICRLFTVYGPRATTSHALINLISKAHSKQNPFEVWGDGEQIRNWTYIDDVIRGILLAAEIIDDSTAINIGTSRGIKVRDAVSTILNYFNHNPEIQFLLNNPVGPYFRVCDSKLAKDKLAWEPAVKFEDGLMQTMEWYKTQSHNSTKIK